VERIKTNEKTTGVAKRSAESIRKRKDAGKLSFLNAYPPNWAKVYHDLDMDLPTGCEMLSYGKKDFAKVSTQAVIPPRNMQLWPGMEW
jgi:hypothetical protein